MSTAHPAEHRSISISEAIRQALSPHAGVIRAAFIFGSVAKRSDSDESDIDLIVIGDDLDYSQLYTAAQSAERTLGQSIDPLFFTSDDWLRKASDAGSVIQKISHAPKLFVIGSEKDLADGKGRTREPGADRQTQGRARL